MELFADFHFLRPWWFAALPSAFLPLLARHVRRADGAGGWRRVVAPELLGVLLDQGGFGGRRARATFHVLATAAFCTAVCALAGPTFERLPQPVVAKRDAVVIVLDLSTSMYARDTPPSRIARAHAAIAGMLRERGEGSTGLVVYAGDAHVVTPLTDDVRNIENLLPALVPDIMPVAGSRPGPALDAARALFPNVGATRGDIVLVTDGVDDRDAVLLRRDPSFPISIVGIGTAAGARIPLDFRGVPGRFMTDDAGAEVHVRLDAPRLADLARAAYGEYRTLEPGDSAWGWPRTARTGAAPRQQTPASEQTFDAWHDVGFWLVLPLLAVACLGFRRGVLAMLACCVLLPLAQAGPRDAAQPWSFADLWERADQRGHALLRAGRADAAAAVFDDPRWRAVARYRAGDVEGAARLFRADDTATGLYNLGTAMARLGALEAAIEVYERVLALAPDHADARHNRNMVAAELQRRAREAAREPPSPGRPAGQDGARGDGPGDGAHGDAANAALEPDSRAEAASDAPSTEGTRDARTRWLESVPDDPGGLLRRKFRHETNQRLREGDYRSRTQGPAW